MHLLPNIILFRCKYFEHYSLLPAAVDLNLCWFYERPLRLVVIFCLSGPFVMLRRSRAGRSGPWFQPSTCRYLVVDSRRRGDQRGAERRHAVLQDLLGHEGNSSDDVLGGLREVDAESSWREKTDWWRWWLLLLVNLPFISCVTEWSERNKFWRFSDLLFLINILIFYQNNQSKFLYVFWNSETGGKSLGRWKHFLCYCNPHFNWRAGLISAFILKIYTVYVYIYIDIDIDIVINTFFFPLSQTCFNIFTD